MQLPEMPPNYITQAITAILSLLPRIFPVRNVIFNVLELLQNFVVVDRIRISVVLISNVRDLILRISAGKLGYLLEVVGIKLVPVSRQSGIGVLSVSNPVSSLNQRRGSRTLVLPGRSAR